MLKLIINADDYGMSKLFNNAIKKTIETGIVTSATVMINRPYIDKKIKKYKNISIGLHLEIDFNSIKDVEEEVLKQYNKFCDFFNQKPSHFDGHKGCIMNYGVLEVIVALAKANDLAVRSSNLEQNKILKQNNIKTTDGGLIWKTNKSAKEVLADLDVLDNGIYEIITHPGYYDSEAKTSLNKQRENDLHFLLSNDFRKYIDRRNIKLINYNQI